MDPNDGDGERGAGNGERAEENEEARERYEEALAAAHDAAWRKSVHIKALMYAERLIRISKVETLIAFYKALNAEERELFEKDADLLSLALAKKVRVASRPDYGIRRDSAFGHLRPIPRWIARAARIPCRKRPPKRKKTCRCRPCSCDVKKQRI